MMGAAAFPLRRWATPLVIGAFLLMAVTGILMFFEIDVGLVAVAHQWFSWIFLIGAGGHLVLNVRSFRNHLKSLWGRMGIAAGAALTIAALFSWGQITGPQIKRPIEAALVEAPIAALAAVTRNAPDTLIDRLAGQGIAADGGDSIRDIALRSGVDENRLLATVFFLD
ncbi:conserved membrane hypothetical protein [uncultured Pleomorphomonas sp.]|uniref:Uncharacterized protein n=1 Tax=uncultured Pleomorphomonas sp. TaxID=442121 RepID=A0A212LDX0_9HYPH|nr:hypothetical protein [uncultured Pleomorphomonas sp.]SCM75725.1 conserved membrane hypothetical protein [uncultured Pleomorphomonas sp.]